MELVKEIEILFFLLLEVVVEVVDVSFEFVVLLLVEGGVGSKLVGDGRGCVVVVL